jgi:hypothetical protein
MAPVRFSSAHAIASRLAPARPDLASMAAWPARRWFVAAVAGALAALLMGIPTGVVPTSFYTRMTPVTWWDYPVWALSALLVGLIAATYVRTAGASVAARDTTKRTLGATLLSTFAIGCPICNKLIVALIGVSGALSYWAPLQPVLGALSLGLLATALALRLRGAAACPAPAG